MSRNSNKRAPFRPGFFPLVALVAVLASLWPVLPSWVSLEPCLPGTVWAGLTAEADSLDARVRALAAEARFGDASEVARALRSLDAEAGADPYHLTWYDVWITSLADAAALPAEGQAAVASANALDSKIQALGAEGLFSEAEAVAREQLALRRQWFGDGHPEVAYALMSLARMQAGQGDPWTAEVTAREGLAILRERFGPTHFLTAGTLEFLATLQVRQGDYAAAERSYRDVAAMRRDRFGKVDPLLSRTLLNLGEVLQKRGDLGAAEYLLRDGLRVNRMAEYAWIPSEATFRQTQETRFLRGLAELLRDKGDLAEAEAYADDAWQSRVAQLGDDHPFVAEDQVVLAQVLSLRGQVERADSLLQSALDLRRRVYGDAHPQTAATIELLGDVRRRQGRLEDATSLYSTARDSLAVRFGSAHPEVAQVDHALFQVALERGDLPGAEILRQRLLETEAGRGHDGVWADVGRLHLARGEHATADSVLGVASELYEHARARSGAGWSRATFRDAPYTPRVLARIAQGDAEGAWVMAERAQGRLLADLLVSAGQRRLPARDAGRLDSLYLGFDQAERRYTALAEAAKRDTTGDAQGRREAAHLTFMQAEAELLAFESEMSRAHPLPAGRSFPLQRIRSTMGRGEAIVGWVDVEMPARRVARWAYVVRSTGSVRWFDLGEVDRSEEDAGDTLRRALSEVLRSLLGRTDASGIAQLSGRVWRDRVAPLLPALEGVRQLFIVSSGALAGVPVDCLTDENGRLFLDRFLVTYVPSATVWAWLRENAPEDSKPSIVAGRARALFVGDPPYRESHLSIVPEPELPTGDVISTLRGALAGNRESLSSLPRLVWSRDEVTSAAQYFEDAQVFVGREASEATVGSMVGSGEMARFDTVHLATHALVDTERPERSALVLSQVDLADPFEAARAGRPFDDGIVTARDIMRTWTLNADLVVLSACETGLGREVNGEGFVGLAHALFQAGARSVLASLWKVDDEATALLMKEFYARWSAGLSKSEALREAKRAVRDYRDDEGVQRFGHPAYWASFILMGDSE